MSRQLIVLMLVFVGVAMTLACRCRGCSGYADDATSCARCCASHVKRSAPDLFGIAASSTGRAHLRVHTLFTHCADDEDEPYTYDHLLRMRSAKAQKSVDRFGQLYANSASCRRPLIPKYFDLHPELTLTARARPPLAIADSTCTCYAQCASSVSKVQCDRCCAQQDYYRHFRLYG
jgi:hypothetical protein